MLWRINNDFRVFVFDFFDFDFGFHLILRHSREGGNPLLVNRKLNYCIK